MPKPPRSNADTSDSIAEIVAFLNATCETGYHTTAKDTRQKITARLREGYSVDDFKTVILKKHAEWGENPVMVGFLRPKTLFAPSNFENYLNQPDTPPRARNPYFDMLEDDRHDQSRDPEIIGAHQDGLS